MKAMYKLRSATATTTLAICLLAICGCQGVKSTGGGPPPPPPPDITSVNHIIFMAQENRSFDMYFGQLPAYWAANGFPSQQFDGMPTNASNSSIR